MLSERVYRYTGIPFVDAVISDFMEAENQGRYYNQNIKGQYVCIEVTSDQSEHQEEVSKDEENTISQQNQTRTLSELLSLKDKINQSLEIIESALSSGLVSKDMVAELDEIRAYISFLEGEKIL